jgi:hypothetical protein
VTYFDIEFGAGGVKAEFEGGDSVPLSAESRRLGSKVSRLEVHLRGIPEGPALPNYPSDKGIPNVTKQPESASIGSGPDRSRCPNNPNHQALAHLEPTQRCTPHGKGRDEAKEVWQGKQYSSLDQGR